MPNHESLLIERAKAGDVPAFEELIGQYRPRLFRFVFACTSNAEDAEDALQETFLQAFRAMPSFRGDASFSTWLHRVALNTAHNWMRSQARASSERLVRAVAIAAPEVPPALDEGLVAEERRRLVQHALAQLPDHYRSALILRHYQEMSYEEMAAVLEIPVGTVRSRIAQGRHLLLERLASTECFQ
jgi:RNA polymerase sigma-70 factor, ECF subfamily